ncbi:SDR family NAD(P)-dependent oxidoreductase [Chloroflexota bacterium]
MYDLTSRVAIVTGAAGRHGFGRAIANRLAKEGADVVVIDKFAIPPRDEELTGDWKGLDSVVEDITGFGRRGLAITCDVSQSQEVDKMVEKVITEFGRVDILVNNAGISVQRSILQADDEIWYAHMAVNLTGTFFCSRAVVREMVKRGEGGRIINIGSLWSKVGGGDGKLPYSASKFGVIGLTQSLALEMASHNILVNAVCPTHAATDLHSSLFKKQSEDEGITVEEARTRMREGIAARIPLGRLGTTEDLANLVAFLVSKEADFITGQSINVNGGAFTAT